MNCFVIGCFSIRILSLDYVKFKKRNHTVKIISECRIYLLMLLLLLHLHNFVE